MNSSIRPPAEPTAAADSTSTAETPAAAPVSRFPGGSAWGCLLRLAGVYLGLGLALLALFTVAVHFLKGISPKARQSQCRANQRVLAAAIADYNASASAGVAGAPRITHLASDTQDLLVRAGCLRSTLSCPGGPTPPQGLLDRGQDLITFCTGQPQRPASPGLYLGEDLVGSGTVRCSLHGGVPH